MTEPTEDATNKMLEVIIGMRPFGWWLNPWWYALAMERNLADALRMVDTLGDRLQAAEQTIAHVRVRK